jgi:hypothetical protein
MERTQPKKPETVAESKYEPTDYERAVLAKQTQRLKEQGRAPRIRFVEDERSGRWEFDHPDQAIAFALLKEAFGTADDQSASGLLHYLCTVLPTDENCRGLKALYDGRTARRVTPRMLKSFAIFLRCWTSAVGLMT